MKKASDFVFYNLYIDESGFYYIGESRYRFFILSAVLIAPDQKLLADQLFAQFRSKYLIDPDRCLHAAEFFEDHNPKYKKQYFKNSAYMRNAIDDLKDIISHLNFYSISAYCDIPRIRKRLSINDPPFKKIAMTKIEKSQYKHDKKIYKEAIKNTIGEKKNCALTMTLHKLLQFHSEKLAFFENHDKYQRLVESYINFESQKESDGLIIDNFHRYQDQNYTYGGNLVGVNLHTKRSLDGGIQLADLISYISCQSLRSKHLLKNEILLNPTMLGYMKELRILLRGKYNVDLINVSEATI